MGLNDLDVLNGTLSIIVVLISLSIGLTIISKYFKYKQITLIYVGLAWIGIFSPWWSSSISFIMALTTGTGLSEEIYFLIGGIFTAFVVYFWTLTICKLTNTNKIIAYILTLEALLLEILYIYFIFTNPLMIGTLNGYVDGQYKAFGALFFVNLMLLFITTTTIFGLKSLKSENPDIKLKGKFLLIGAYTFIIGAFLDTAIPLSPIVLIITRTILTISGLLFYCGFVLPRFIKELFLKED